MVKSRTQKNRKNSEYRLLERRQVVASLYVQGLPQWRIAERLGVCTSLISSDLQVIKKQWWDSCLENVEEKVAVEVAKIDNLEREAWDAWQRSRQPLKRAKDRTILRVGDPRYLDRVAWCIEMRLKLMGCLRSPVFNRGPEGTGSEEKTIKVDWASLALADDVPDVIEGRISEEKRKALVHRQVQLQEEERNGGANGHTTDR